VFQNYREALFPWLTASIDNIEYPLKLMKATPPRRSARSNVWSRISASRSTSAAIPYELSGGQQQLVSIMRALVVEPEVLFLDEPFSALDYEMTLFMREQLQRIFMETGTTMVLVSHDLEEAVYLADRILLLSRRARADRRFSVVAVPRPRNDARFPIPTSSRSRDIASRYSSARCASNVRQARSLPAAARRRRTDLRLVCRLLDQDRRSGAAPVSRPTRWLPCGGEWPAARCCTILHRPSFGPSRDCGRGRRRDSAWHRSRSERAALPVGGIRRRFLPLDAGVGDVPALSGDVRRRRCDQGLCGLFRRRW
jgi:energy-coupling factor transporter ATP-binding protein EcfA2